jgi:predicted transcriptional regulator of viral defense system
MPAPIFEDRLREVAHDHNGLFLAREAEQAGVNRHNLSQLARRGRVERVARGIYAFPNWPTTETRAMDFASLWPHAQHNVDYALLSHDSALELYGLTDLNPAVVHVTVPKGYRERRRERPRWLRVHQAHIDERDRTFERGIPTVSVVRAIEDIASTRGLDVVASAIDEAMHRNLLREDELRRLTSQFGDSILPEDVTAVGSAEVWHARSQS